MSTSYSLAKAQSCQIFNQNLVPLFVFSFSYFALRYSRAISFVFNKIPFRHFVCFGKIINCTAVQLMKELYSSQPISIQ